VRERGGSRGNESEADRPTEGRIESADRRAGDGDAIDLVEQSLAEMLGVTHVIALELGCLGPMMAFEAAGLGPKDHVLLSPFASPAVAHALALRGCAATLVDTDRVRPQMKLDVLKKSITRRTRAIVATHVGGCFAQMDEILDIALDRGLIVIEEASGMAGCRYRAYEAGSLGHAAFVDMGAAQAFAGCAGGFLATSVDTLAERARIFARGGRTRPNLGASMSMGIETVGFECRMSEAQAARVRACVEGVEASIAQLTAVARAYSQAFSGAREVTVPDWLRQDGPVAQYMVRIDFEAVPSSRTQIERAIQSHGFATDPPYRPLQSHPYFQQILKLKPGCAESSEVWCRRAVPLPLGPRITERDAREIAKTVRGLVGG
jgi:perosamine synthetase